VAQKWLKVWEVGLLFDFKKLGTFLQERKLKFCQRLAESFIKDESKLKHKSTSTKIRKLFFEPTMNVFEELLLNILLNDFSRLATETAVD
jgi:hypothetical protein